MRARRRIQVLAASLAVLLAIPALPAPLARAAGEATVHLSSPTGEVDPNKANVWYGDPFTIVATIDPDDSAGPEAVIDGSVTFTGLGDPVTVPVTAGIAEHTWPLPTASAGIQATYHDGSEYVAPSPGVYSLAVLPVPVNVAYAAKPASPEFGAAVSLDVTLDPSEPTASGWTREDVLLGGVSVFLVPPSGPDIKVGEQPITGGETAVPLSLPSGAPFPADSNAIRVEYTGGMVPATASLGFAPGSATGTLAVAEAPASVSVTGPAAVTYGSAQTYAVTVGPWAAAYPPLGAVRLFDGSPATGVQLGAWLLDAADAGVASISLPRSLAVGAHQLVATFDGNTPSAADPNRLDGTSAALDVTVGAASLTPVVTAESKTYDGTVEATIASRTLSGDVVEGDLVYLTGGSAAFSDTNVGSAKAVSVTGLALGGPDADNYTLATTTASTTASIGAAPTTISVSSSPNPAPVGATVTLTARATWAGGAPTGSVVFRDGSTSIGGAIALVNGSASLVTAWSGAATHDITAAFVPDSANLAATTSPVLTQVVGRSGVSVELTADPGAWETDVPITFTARLAPAAAGVTAALTGDVAFHIDDVPVARVPVVAGAASYRAQLATAGGHTIVAAFVPDAAGAAAFDGGASAPLTRTVVANTVGASGVSVSSTSIYPHRDGWLDTLAIRGSRSEPLGVSVRIYRPTGSLLATRSVAVGTGTYTSTWNGRSGDGTILPAGRYRVVQTLSDPSSVPPLVRSWTAYVTLSAKRMVWTTVSLPRDANAPARWSGSPSRLSSTRYRSGARLLTSWSTPGWAALGYSFTLPSASAIRSVAFSVQGGPWTGPTAPKIGLHDWRTGADWTAMYDGTRTRKPVGTSTASWYSIPGDPAVVVRTISGKRYVRAFVDTGGHVTGFRYELSRVRLVVTYGVLK